MRIKHAFHFSFKNHLQKVYHVHEDIDEHDIGKLLTEFNRLNFSFGYATPLLFAIDYTKASYVIMTEGSQSITGYHPGAFMEAGIPILLDIYQKDDFKVYNEKIFTLNADFLKNQPQTEHHKFIFSYNFRVRHTNRNYVPVFQRGCYITSKQTGLPLYSIGMILDISLFKKDTLMHHSIEKIENNDGFLQHQLVCENYFYPNGEDTILSKHERTILAYMAEGFSSKQLAHKMKLSENTIDTHRKNMLKKTNTKNVAELVAFACKNMLI